MCVTVSNKIQDLPETGEAWLVDSDGVIIAKFYDGHMTNSAAPCGNCDKTKVA